MLHWWGSSIQKCGFINGVDNVNWPLYSGQFTLSTPLKIVEKVENCLFYLPTQICHPVGGGEHVTAQNSLKCPCDLKKITFPSDFESVFALHPTGKILRPFTLSVSFGFHGSPLLTFKPDQLDLRGLDLGKCDVKASLA